MVYQAGCHLTDEAAAILVVLHDMTISTKWTVFTSTNLIRKCDVNAA